MSDVTDLNAFRDAKSQPDPQHVAVIVEDGRPVKWFEFGVEFDADGKSYGFTIWARDAAHAELQLAAIRTSSRIVGQLYATVEA